MAWTSGTATNYLDLMAQLKDYISNASVHGAQAWTIKRWDPAGELIAMGPGLAGTDQIYVGMKAYNSVSGDYYNWKLNGFTAYDNVALFLSQPGSINRGADVPTIPSILLWNSPIPYWFVVNGRRIVMVAKIGIRYESMYLGHILPYGTSGQFPYPMAVGGSYAQSAGTVDYRYSNDGTSHQAFMFSTDLSAGSNGANWNTSSPTSFVSQLRLRKPDGSWIGFQNTTNSAKTSVYTYHGYYKWFGETLTLGPRALIWPFALNLSQVACVYGTNDAILYPAILMDDSPNSYGELDGVYCAIGKGIGPESVITQGSDQYIVFPNVYRLTREDLWALKLS